LPSNSYICSLVTVIKKYILLIFCLLGLLQANAQVPDSVIVNSTYYRTFTEGDIFENYATRFQPLDTFITDFHIYNAAVKKYSMNTTLGNIGLPARNPIGSPYRGLGFDLGINQLSLWEQSKYTTTYYRSRAPFIEASYFNGSQREQNFFLNLNQNITKGWNVGLRFERLNSQGFYQRQNSDNTNWLLYSSYQSKNEKYRLVFSGARNNMLARQNGGLATISQFTDNTESNRQLYDVNLLGANNVWRSRYAHVQQSFDLKRWSDTTAYKTDTVKLQTNTALRLYHVFDLAAKALIYNDTAKIANTFYPVYNYDTLATNDRTNNTIIENRVGLKLLSERIGREARVFDAFAGHQLIKYYTHTWGLPDSMIVSNTTNNVYVGGNVKLPLFKGFGLNGSATIFLAGYNIGDYEGRFSISKSSIDTLGNTTARFDVGLMVKAYEPTYLQSRYVSNNFSWDNNFKKTFANTLFVNYTNQRLKVDASAWITDIRQYVYFNEQALPQQAKEGLQIFALQLVKRFQAKKWHFDGYATGQYVASPSKLLPLPNLVLRTSIYYRNYVFKKALLLDIGLDVFYNTAFKAPNYMPATGQFYIQQTTSVGNYPYIDLFIDAQIKKARIFLKIEHVNSGLFGQTYLQYPNHPMNDRTFKLGINWRFFN
jgi:hypothetical protein